MGIVNLAGIRNSSRRDARSGLRTSAVVVRQLRRNEIVRVGDSSVSMNETLSRGAEPASLCLAIPPRDSNKSSLSVRFQALIIPSLSPISCAVNVATQRSSRRNATRLYIRLDSVTIMRSAGCPLARLGRGNRTCAPREQYVEFLHHAGRPTARLR